MTVVAVPDPVEQWIEAAMASAPALTVDQADALYRALALSRHTRDATPGASRAAAA